MWTFGRWGGAFTPPIVIFALHHMSWRWAFVCFGSLGVVWTFFFNRWFRDRPEDSHRSTPRTRAAEKRQRQPAPHGDVALGETDPPSQPVADLGAVFSACRFLGIFYITWLPTYLQEYRHQTPEAASRLAILPLLFGGFGALTCGLSFPGSPDLGQHEAGAPHDRNVRVLAAALMLFLSTRI